VLRSRQKQGINALKKPTVIISIILTVLIGAGLVFSVMRLIKSDEVQGYLRQKTEEGIAEDFVREMEERISKVGIAEKEDSDPVTRTRTETIVGYTDSDYDYTDDAYYERDGITYTPEYAKGYLDCVLEIPCIGLRRGVYSGTMEEISHDFDIWMTTAGHPDYVLGETHYCINGHNHPSQSLSFNKLKEVQEGDYFTLTDSRYVYFYDVTRILVMWRPTANEDLINNWDLSSDLCYILTCGRDENRYRDLIVEGTLREKYPLSEWEEVKGELTATRIETDVQVEYELGRMKLEGSVMNGELIAKVTYPDGTPCPGLEVVVGDSDGIFLQDGNGSYVTYITDEEGKCSIPVSLFQEGETYVVGVLEFSETEYQAPNDLEITYKTERRTVPVVEEAGEEAEAGFYLYVWIGLVVALMIFFVLCIIETVKTIKCISKKSKCDGGGSVA